MGRSEHYDYCLFTDDIFLISGREVNGECVPFTEKNYGYINMGTTVRSLAGTGNVLAVGTNSQVRIYDITDPFNPDLLHTENIYGPADDMLVYNNRLIIAVENGIDAIDLEDYSYFHKATYGSTKVLRIYENKLYAGDGQGIKVLDPLTLDIENQKNTTGDVTKLEIIGGIIHTFEWAGLKRHDVETLDAVPTDSYYIDNPEMSEYRGNIYVSKNNYIVQLAFDESEVIEIDLIGDKIDLRNTHSHGLYTYTPDGMNLRVSTIEYIPEPYCGDGIINGDEVCDGNDIACTDLSSNYIGGTATCLSDCSGYNTEDCEVCDGWGC
jgi:hypothetical protein